jgi:hypothetical protein
MAQFAQNESLSLKTMLMRAVASEGTETSMKLMVQVEIPSLAPDDEPVKPGCVIQVGELDQEWLDTLKPETSVQVDSLSEAIHGIIAQHRLGASAAALVISPGAEVKDTSALIAAIELLNRIDMPMYVISCASAIDHRLLSQFATLSGGEFALLDSPSAIDASVESILQRAKVGVRRVGFLTVEVPSMMNIESFCTVSPQFGLIQLSAASRPKTSISFPLLSVGHEASSRHFLLSINTPPLSKGRYHLAHLKCIEALTEHNTCLSECRVDFSILGGSTQPSSIEPMVARLSEKLQLTMLVELIAQAYLREDGGTISRTLSQIESALLRLEQGELALRIGNLRVNFLHRGSFALPELNETWLLADRASRSLMEVPE